ncbi:MAG: glycosyltransferase family 4 protein, partial [Planctomycetota bacterium]
IANRNQTMRALWLVRDNLLQHPGGDTTQICQTAAALRASGVQVDMSSEPRPRMDNYDVVHLFHLDRVWENEAHCRHLRTARRPAVLSTIYWPADEFDRGGRAGMQGLLARMFGSSTYQNLRFMQRALLHALRNPSLHNLRPRWRFNRAARNILESVKVILPNSRAEQEQIEKRFNIARPTVVVPNAANTQIFNLPPASRSTERAGVLCVGRLEPRKNQLALIEALRDSEIQLTIVGHAGRYSSVYQQRCHQAAGSNVEFVDQQPPEKLNQLYQTAKVHACVSWYETPGLASLEAALCGCTLVVTPGGSTREYFGEQAHYCQPNDRQSILSAVQAALSAPPASDLANRVAQEYTWSAAAAKTLVGYEQALSTDG